MAEAHALDDFRFSADDPLADAHQAVQAWIEEAASILDESGRLVAVDPKSLSSGERLLKARPAKARCYLLAAIVQAQHWNDTAEQIAAQATNDFERVNPHQLPGWSAAWRRRWQAEAVINALIRRALPLQNQDLLRLIQWCIRARNISTDVARALKRYASREAVDAELAEAMKEFANHLRSAYHRGSKAHATVIEQLCAGTGTVADDETFPLQVQPPPKPAPAGSRGVLVPLKRLLNMTPTGPEPAATRIGPDQFPLADDSPLRSEHGLLSPLFEEVVGTRHYAGPDLKELDIGRKLLALPPARMGRALLAAAERYV